MVPSVHAEIIMQINGGDVILMALLYTHMNSGLYLVVCAAVGGKQVFVP